MINGFEEITKELTDYERDKILPNVVMLLQHRIGKDKAMTNGFIIDKLRYLNQSTTQPRLRKIIHCIRITGRIERLVATSKGYYIAETDEELARYIESLHQRADSILSIANQLSNQLHKTLKDE